MTTGTGRDLVPLRSRAAAALITATVLSSMTGFLDASVVTVAVPAISQDLGASLAALQWSITGYLLTAAALLLVAGSFADRYGRRRVLVTGLLIMLVASVACALAPSFGVLIAARVLQGAGAALVVPSSLALLNGTLRVPDRAQGIGIWAALASLGMLVGPFAGGWLVDHVSWRSIFLLNIPLIGAALVALVPVPESGVTGDRLTVDAVGAVLAVVGLAGLIDGLTAGATAGWTSVRVVAGLAVGVACLIALVPAERRVRAPMLKLSLFASRQFSAINLATVVFYGALAAAGYLLVLQCELRLGYTAAEAGALLIPSSVVFIALSPVSGALVTRVGPRWLMTAGILAVGAACVWLAGVRPGVGYAEAILPGALLWGVGLGLTVTPLTAAVLAAVADADLGEASAISDVAARFGGAVMTALVPVLVGVRAGRSLTEALVGGYRPAMLIIAGLCVVAAAISAAFVRDARTAAPRFAPHPPYHGCALPDPLVRGRVPAAANRTAGAP